MRTKRGLAMFPAWSRGAIASQRPAASLGSPMLSDTQLLLRPSRSGPRGPARGW